MPAGSGPGNTGPDLRAALGDFKNDICVLFDTKKNGFTHSCVLLAFDILHLDHMQVILF